MEGHQHGKRYGELGWETLNERRMFRRLTQFYKIMHGLTPDYLRTPTLPLQLNSVTNRFANVFRLFRSRTDKYRSIFFPDSVAMWNDMPPELREAESLSVFKRDLMKFYRPKKK